MNNLPFCYGRSLRSNTHMVSSMDLLSVRIVNMSDANALAEALTTYEFDRIVFFSENLTPRSDRDGDLGALRRLLHAIRNRQTQMLMVSGPESEFTYPENDDVSDTSKSLMSRASEELCLYYARTYRLEAKIIRCPYLSVAGSSRKVSCNAVT